MTKNTCSECACFFRLEHMAEYPVPGCDGCIRIKPITLECQCRRHSPVISDPHFPRVTPDMFCFDFIKKENA